ncbi:helix-turn-helix transcriptional regulator [Gemmatimonas sp.]|uniref:helix-turn-helix transcriptional regulator n=1 Tax=Gemmatimonas sp. TaxID=1962908 RepID=UPI003342C138
MTDPTDMLRTFVAASGLTPTEMARVLGRDDRTMRRWLSGEQEVPDTLAQQIARLRVTAVDDEGVHLVYQR